MFVRLSDGGNATNSKKEFPFVYIPPMRAYVREDFLDDLTDQEWRILMAQIAAYQPAVQNGQRTVAQEMADKATRRERRKKRTEQKQEKKDSKRANKDARAEIKKARAERIKSGKGSDVLGTVMQGIKAFTGQGSDAEASGSGYEGPPAPEEAARTPWLFTPTGMLVGGLTLATVVGGGIYLATRKNN